MTSPNLSEDAEVSLSEGRTTTVGELRKRCYVASPGIIVLGEPPYNTGDSYRVLVEAAKELGRQFGRYTIIVDCTDVTERPKGEYMDCINDQIRASDGGAVVHWCLVNPSNPFLRAVMRFLLGRLHGSRVSVHEAVPRAIDRAREELENVC